MRYEDLLQLHAYFKKQHDQRPADEEVRELRDKLFKELETQRHPDFDLTPSGFAVNGKAVRKKKGKDISTAWMCLVSREYGLEPHKWTRVWPSRTAALNAVSRAAKAVERYNPALAAEIRSIGVKDDYLIAKGTGSVRCGLRGFEKPPNA